MLYLIYLVSCFLCGYFPGLLKQEARRHQVNKVKRILLKLPVSIYLLESITWIPTQILSFDGHFENYATACTLISSLGYLWALSIGTFMIFKFTITFAHSIFWTCKSAKSFIFQTQLLPLFKVFQYSFSEAIFFKISTHSLHNVYNNVWNFHYDWFTATPWNFKINLSYEPVKNPRYNIHCFDVMLIFPN